MIQARLYPYGAVGLVAALALACAGGADELERALQAVTENDLAIMVLAQDDLGAEFADLEVDEDSGFQGNDDEADDTIDPADTAADLARAGRINGYGLEYSDPDLSALEEGQGLVSVSTGLNLFRDADAASGFIAKQIDDFRRFEGMEVEPGFTLEGVDRFSVDDLGDEAIGLRLHGSFAEADLYSTAVVFRMGRLVAGTGITRADDNDVTADAERIARALEGRIKGVLLGDITGTPVPLPEKKEQTVPPPGGPDLAAMALSLDDLPAGVSIEREGYVEDEDTVASYEREFDLGLVPIGGSQLIGLENDIDLYEDAMEASAVAAALEALFTSESAAEFFASGFAEGAGFEASNVQVEAVPLPSLGDGSFGVRFTYDTPPGPFENIFIFVQVERAVGTLILSEQPAKVAIRDVVTLAEAMTARMEAVLAAGP